MRWSTDFACLFYLILFLVCPFLTWAGVIRTTVTSQVETSKKGRIDLNFDIENQGNATAHNVRAALIIHNILREYPDLGDNLAGGKINCRDHIVSTELMSGWYQGVLRVDFEEQNGKKHFAYHLFNVSYPRLSKPFPGSPVILKAVPPRFNQKAFWDKTEDLQIFLNNRGETAADVHLNLFLPEGFESPDSETQFRLAAGEEKNSKFDYSSAPRWKK